ncbi:MAG: DUF1398 family protein [Actinobacteria bacterium]|nr:DUF1398 family protein [Actinomycetota bacterium]
MAEIGDRHALLEHLRQHADGETSYLELSRALAACGVDRWVADTGGLTMTYRDRAGTALLVEQVG